MKTLYSLFAGLLSGIPMVVSASNDVAVGKAAHHLMDRADDGLARYIYKDLAWPGNMDYAPSGLIGTTTTLKVNESFKGKDVGGTCIRLDQSGTKWSGVYWQRPAGNWGDGPEKSGINLSGATKLSFRAKALKEPVICEFGVGGITGSTGDSTKKRSGKLKFGTEWQPYSLDLGNADLRHIIGGFYFGMNERGSILIDDIRFDLKRPVSTARFTPSFQIQQPSSMHPVNFCAAHVYDQAMAMISLAEISRDAKQAAALRKSARSHLKVQANAMLAAMEKDRAFSDGRLRNVYWGGADLLDSAGKARLDGWWSKSKQEWLEDQYSVSTSTGNMAWAGLALTEAWDVLQKPDQQGTYLSAAKRIATWIENHTRDETGGYRGGVAGWDGEQTAILWKSTEHNLDVVALGKRLFAITGEAKWKRMSAHAKSFVDTMFDAAEGHYWTGTKDNGSINRDVIPLDCQTWAALALGDTPQTRSAVQWALGNLKSSSSFAGKTVSGYSFGTAQSGVWPEGTAQMALAWGLLGSNAEASAALASLRTIQSSHPNGNRRGIVAACDDFQGTGFDSNRYFAIPHIGATAWFILAQTGKNPMK